MLFPSLKKSAKLLAVVEHLAGLHYAFPQGSVLQTTGAWGEPFETWKRAGAVVEVHEIPPAASSWTSTRPRFVYSMRLSIILGRRRCQCA